MEVNYTPQFIRRVKKLPPAVQEQLFLKVEIFKQNWQDPILKSHKLSGKLKDYWSFSVDYDYRIIFKKEPKRFILLTVGTHDQVY